MSEVAICPVGDCKSTVDVVLKSSDGELFGAHQRNLEIYTEGFPIAGSTVVSGPVSLEETAEVLHLLLRYTHHIRLPMLDEISFTLLVPLAGAAEKYMIYSAMEACRTRMTQTTDDHPIEVFFYSIKHNYPYLADKAAKSTLKKSVSSFLALFSKAGLPDHVALRWTCYRHHWMEGLAQLPDASPGDGAHLKSGSNPKSYCSEWDTFQVGVFGEARRDLSSLDRIFEIIEKHKKRLDKCTVCESQLFRWRSQVTKMVKNLPKYSEVSLVCTSSATTLRNDGMWISDIRHGFLIWSDSFPIF